RNRRSRTDQQQQQQQSAARRTTKRTAKAKTAAAVLDNRLLIEGWVERSETHRLQTRLSPSNTSSVSTRLDRVCARQRLSDLEKLFG
ncbi:MAG: hypothetical protein U1C54_01100, partial [Xanthomonadaceae bacterium]|nr:hypothetical protein [Xanthomonadaceae bacterium]